MNRHQPDRMKHVELARLLSERFPDRAKGPYTHGWVSHKLSGDQGVRLDELHALADIFNTTISYLVGETDAAGDLLAAHFSESRKHDSCSKSRETGA